MREETRCRCVGAVVLTVGMLWLNPTFAQTAPAGQPAAPGKPAAPAYDRTQVETYVRVMSNEVELAEAREGAVTAQLKALDADIESRVDRMVSLLSTVHDSADESGVRIREAKEDVLTGLKETAEYYAQQRDRRRKEMDNRYAQIGEEELARDVAALNVRIEKRVAQSLAIAKSLPQHKEGAVDRYRDTDTDYSQESTEYRKTKRDVRAGVEAKEDLVAELRASIEKQTKEKNALEAQLRTTSDPQQRERLTEDVEQARKTIEARRSQVEELLMATAPSTRAVGSKGGLEVDRMLREMAKELRGDFVKFKTLVNERDAARARVKPLQERLGKAMAVLEALPPAGGQ